MYLLRVKTHFDAAHYIRDYVGKCMREHGHRWVVEVVVGGTELDRRNILVDFSEVKSALNYIVDTHLDHYQLNESLGKPNITAEYLAEWLYRQVKARVIDLNIVEVSVWESPDCGATYYGDAE